MSDHDTIPAERLAALRREIQIGLDQLDNGEGIAHDTDSLREMFEQLKRDARLGLDDLEQSKTVLGKRVFKELLRRSEERRNQ